MFARARKHGFDDSLRDSGIPPPGRLGASRNELIGLVLMLFVFAAIFVSFWLESTR